MTTAQTKLYFREWGAARKILREAGFSAADADAERLAIHRENGLPESSKDFNRTTHLDTFIKACRKVTGKSSIHIDDQARKRLVHRIEKTGLDDAYLNKICRDKKEGMDWRALPISDLEKLSFTAINRARKKA